MGITRFPVRFAGFGGGLLRALGVRPATSAVEIGDSAIRVRVGWMFSLSAAPPDVAAAAPVEHRWWWGVGVHLIGRHTWVANGSTDGLVELRFRRLVPARLAGVPIRIARLVVSVEDPDGLVRLLSPDP